MDRIGPDTHGQSEQPVNEKNWSCLDYTCIHNEDEKCTDPELDCQYVSKECCEE